MHTGGQTVLLRHGDYEACIVTVGAGLCSLKYKDRYITIPHNPDEVPLAHLGKVLIPWPNRIKDGKYEFDGKSYQLAINDLKTMSASHGFLAWKEWQIEDLNPRQVILKSFVIPTLGYPFILESHAIYTLSADGLDIELLTDNIGKESAPYGVGQHPYISCNLKSLDECELSFPCTKVLAVDERMCPTQVVEAQSVGLDFSTKRSLKGVKLDHAYQNTEEFVSLTLSSNEMEVSVDSEAPYIQLFSAEKLDRKGLAVEPMSCPANAFNSGRGLVILNPGERHNLHYTISAKLL